MPLFELLHRLTKGKLDSSQDNTPTTSNDPSFVPPENDFDELLWENGQIQTSRARKVQSCNNLPSQILNIRDSDIGNGTSTKMGKYGSVLEPELSEVPIPVPSVELGLNQDDDMVPWLNYPINESLQVQHDFRSEFMPEFSGVTVNEHSENNFLSSGKRRSGDQSSRDDLSSVHSGLNLEQGNMPKASSDGNGESSRARTSVGELYPQQYPTSFSYFGSMVSGNKNDSMSNSGNHALPGAGDTICPTAGGGFHSIKMQKQVPVPLPPTTNSTVMNFSHFSRPAALVKANLRNVGARAGSGISSLEQIGSKYKGSTTSSSNPSQPMLIEPCSGLRYDSNSSCHPIVVSSKVDANFLEARLGKEHVPDELPVAMNQEDDPKSKKNCSENFGGSTDKKFTDGEKTIEPVVASSSVCSVNSVERPSDDPAQTLKRKNRDTEESEGPSEDFEEESVDAKKVTPARVGGSKRSRAAEVHNLSERRRRDRINEKMRALQELIPNCNKVDKASMLDEAIEYLKTLQLQVQIMSMGSGLYMPSMMLPPGMPHMHAAHMAQFSPMTAGMGMGFAMGMPDMNGGSSGCSVIQVPPMYGPQFPIPPMSGPSAFHGMRGPNLQMLGISGQGIPMPFPRPPLIPISGGPLLKPTMGPDASRLACPVENLDSAPASSSKDLIQNINSQCMQNNGANSSMNPTTSQCQTTNECFEQSGLVQSNAQESEFTDNGTLQSAGAEGNDDDESIRTSGCDS